MSSPTDVDDRNELGRRIQGHPHEDVLLEATQFGDPFVHLQLGTHQVVKKVVVEPLGVSSGAVQPTLDGPLIMLENPAGRGDIHPLAGGGHDFIHPSYRRFQVVPGCIPTHTELRVARLAAQVLMLSAPW
ncbi:MAG TPA: hypothetical protein VMT34_06995 [Aggregatilineales bacterium]|nr:hypothetical protein [Aggregatilineales bacterium]